MQKFIELTSIHTKLCIWVDSTNTLHMSFLDFRVSESIREVVQSIDPTYAI